jgi:acetolactate synthase-1/2/3 large subunit
VFGLPGTQNVDLFEALRRSRLRTVLATHELAASFMANGYARASGDVGVLFTIPGPGFTWALTGLAEARLDSAPLLHVVGQPARGPGRRFQHQAIPQHAMVAPLVKRVVAVEDVAALAEGVAEAWRTALEGEPGPVVLHLAPGVVGAEIASTAERAMTGQPAAGPSAGQGDPPQWHEALRRRVAAARRPLLFVGQGAAGAAGLVRQVAEELGVPVASTLSGRGVLPEDHDWSLAYESLRSGVGPMNELLAGCDLVLAVGCKLGHSGSAGFGLALARDVLVHADTSADVLGANYEAGLAIHASAQAVLDVVRQAVAGRARSTDWTTDEVADWRSRLRGHPPDTEPRVHGLSPGTAAALFGLLRRHLARDALVLTDSGLHQYLVRRHFEVLAPRGLITPADFQSMGYGLPATIGAALACPERPVVAVIGDGGLAMSAMELLTAVREAIPLTLIVFNDGQLNLIRHQQVRDWGHTHAVRLLNPDMAALAASMGADYRLLDDDPDAALAEALASSRPVLVEVRLGDAPSFRALQARSLARSGVRRLLGPELLGRLRRLLRRG